MCEKFFGYGGDERFSVSDCLSSELLLSFLHNYIDNEFCCSEDWERKKKKKKKRIVAFKLLTAQFAHPHRTFNNKETEAVTFRTGDKSYHQALRICHTKKRFT
jgi:hypothetical protein